MVAASLAAFGLTLALFTALSLFARFGPKDETSAGPSQFESQAVEPNPTVPAMAAAEPTQVEPVLHALLLREISAVDGKDIPAIGTSGVINIARTVSPHAQRRCLA